MSIDSSERWLHGTPQEGDVPAGDVVGIPFGLIATDSSGSATLNVTLVVSRNAAPTVEIPISEQLEESGLPYSEPSSLLAYPSSYFNFSFSQATFSRQDLNYYAVSSDNTPMPSWIAFDTGQLLFSGTTPPADSLVEPPQTFNFQLIASDVTGFSAASIGFSIVVGSHEITADDPAVILNATVGKELVYSGLQQGIKLDGQVAGPSNLTAKIVAGSSSPPDWLTFDPSTWLLSGTPPSSAQNAAFLISFSDALADTTNVTFQVGIDENGTVFRDVLPAVQAQRGSAFSVDLDPYLVSTTGINVTIESEPKQDWITFNASTMTISGDVPIDETDSSISISIRASLGGSGSTESETFLLQIMPGSAQTSPSPSSSSASASPTSTSTVAAAAAKSSTTSTRTILLAVLIPTMLLLLVLIVLACCFCCRKRRERNSPSQLSNRDISEPVPFSFAYDGQDNVVSSMRALDKEYKVSNLNSIYAAQKQAVHEKEKTAEDGMPVGTALTLTDAGGVVAGSDYEEAAQDPVPSDLTLSKSDSGQQSSIPDFPAPPFHTFPGQPPSVPSSSGGSRRSLHTVPTGTSGQWPFEASTLKSSVHTRGSSHAGSNGSNGSHGTGTGHRDALGIISSGGAGTLASKGSGSVVTRQMVRTSTPLKMDVLLQGHGGDSSSMGGLRSEPTFASQEAVVHDGQSSVGTAVEMGYEGAGDRESPARSDPIGSHSTLPVHDGELLGDNVAPDLEAGVVGAAAGAREVEGGDIAQQDAGSRPLQRPGFFAAMAAQIASRLRRGMPKPRAAKARFSMAAATTGHPSPNAPSFDSDMGSVTFGNVTTVQPYRPRPVFIGSGNRASADDAPQQRNSQWRGRNSAANRISQARGPPEQVFPRIVGGGDEGEGAMHSGHAVVEDDSESITGSDAAADEAIRLDPPRPAFLAPSSAERDATSDLSHEIASSLGNRRPTSTSSGVSGISAAMEEVRSLLLGSNANTPSLQSPAMYQQDMDGRMRHPSSPSSNSWETLSSSEPNWTSLFEYVMPAQRAAPGTAATAVSATEGDSEELLTPATGAGMAAFGGHNGLSRPLQPVQPHFQAHQAQQAPAAQRGVTAAQAADAQGYAADSHDDDNDLALSGRGFRHTSSYYADDPVMAGSLDYEYPPPFVVGGDEDQIMHFRVGREGSDGGSGLGGDGSGPSIGLAVSKYSQPDLTQASMASNASSGIRAFI